MTKIATILHDAYNLREAGALIQNQMHAALTKTPATERTQVIADAVATEFALRGGNTELCTICVPTQGGKHYATEYSESAEQSDRDAARVILNRISVALNGALAVCKVEGMKGIKGFKAPYANAGVARFDAAKVAETLCKKYTAAQIRAIKAAL